MTEREQNIIQEYLHNLKVEGINTPKRLFDTPYIKELYEELKRHKLEENTAIKVPESYHVVLAWLALLSGDNPTLYSLSKRINEKHLDKHFLSFFEELKALSGLFGEVDERLEHSLKAFELLGEQDRSFFKANAMLTHGQILVGLNRLREAADFFYKAYDLFIEHQMFFPAVVSLTNALLNYFKLGELNEVKSMAKHTFLISSAFGKKEHIYLDILRLPLGMCYLEEMKLNLALDNLKKAQRTIDALKLIHMHGYIEIYLLKTVALLNDKVSLKTIIDEAQKTYQNMHYPMMGWITLYGKILLEGTLSKQEIELLQTSLAESPYKPSILIEMLCYLHHQSKIRTFSKDILLDSVKTCRYNGNVVELQVYLLHLGEYYFLKNDLSSAETILKEAVEIFQKNGLKAAFYTLPFHFWSIINNLTDKIPLPDDQTLPIEALTSREIEILSLISHGKKNNEIAHELFISLGTVKWHISNIFGKLGVKNRIKAVQEAKRFGFLK